MYKYSAICNKKIKKYAVFSAIKILQLLVIKYLDPDPHGNQRGFTTMFFTLSYIGTIPNVLSSVQTDVNQGLDRTGADKKYELQHLSKRFNRFIIKVSLKEFS